MPKPDPTQYYTDLKADMEICCELHRRLNSEAPPRYHVLAGARGEGRIDVFNPMHEFGVVPQMFTFESSTLRRLMNL